LLNFHKEHIIKTHHEVNDSSPQLNISSTIKDNLFLQRSLTFQFD